MFGMFLYTMLSVWSMFLYFFGRGMDPIDFHIFSSGSNPDSDHFVFVSKDQSIHSIIKDHMSLNPTCFC